MDTMIYCCGCEREVSARLTTGEEIYPHREDLHHLPFWICDQCKNYVGCHHKSRAPTEPLGCIPTSEIRAVRVEIHAILDGLWKSRKMRGIIYAKLSRKLGRQYHTADIRSKEEADEVLQVLERLTK